MSTVSPGKLVIISGPSGSGKSTIVRRLIDECGLPLVLCVSVTTRPARQGEQDGVQYFFVSHDEFARRKEGGDFLECNEVFNQGHWYGTLRDEVSSGLQAGKWVILEVDVDGALAALEHHPHAITIFLHPGSVEELERRLRSRGTDSEESIERRLTVARRELTFIQHYRFEVINDTIERAVHEICDILTRCGDDAECSKN